MSTWARDYIVERYGSAPPEPDDWYDRGGILTAAGPHGVTSRPEQRIREQIQWGLRYIRETCGRRRPTL